jgi:hypothetical protein
MDKDKLAGKFVKIFHGNLFDKFLIFGTIEQVDELDNIHLKISMLFGMIIGTRMMIGIIILENQ